MLLTSNLERPVLYDPARTDGDDCNRLKIVTGFTDCDMIAQHLIQLHSEQGRGGIHGGKINIDIIVGMYRNANLTRQKHIHIMQTLKKINAIDPDHIETSCKYVYRNQQVHSKVYAWLRDDEPVRGFAGSANYTINAFRVNRESLADCSGKEASAYYDSLLCDTIGCFDENLQNVLILPDATAHDTEAEVSPDNLENLTYEGLMRRTPLDTLEVSWLGEGGHVGTSSGPNWGIRKAKGYTDKNGKFVKYGRDPNQAYIPYNRREQKPGFFPDRINPDDRNCPLFKAVTKDSGIFYMRMAQDNNKALHTAASNALLGKWLRKCLGVPDGAPVTDEDFKRYGKSKVTFYKFADDVFVMDF